jgi:hypothetical protein
MLSSYDLRTNHRCKHPHKLTVSLIVKERRQIVFSETVKYESDRSDLSTPCWLLTASFAVLAAEARCAFYVVVNLCQPLFALRFEVAVAGFVEARRAFYVVSFQCQPRIFGPVSRPPLPVSPEARARIIGGPFLASSTRVQFF